MCCVSLRLDVAPPIRGVRQGEAEGEQEGLMWGSSSMRGWIYIIIFAIFWEVSNRHGQAQVHGAGSQAVTQCRQRKDEWREAAFVAVG